MQRVKPHKKKKLRTLASDLSSSTEYENYVSQLDTLPKMSESALANQTAAGHRASFNRLDSSDEEAEVNKLSNNVMELNSRQSQPGEEMLEK